MSGRPGADQNPFMADGGKKLKKEMAKKGMFARNYDEEVDMDKVELGVITPWIQARVVELMGFEDDIVIGYIKTQLEKKPDSADYKLDAKELQMSLTPFLEKHAKTFCHELWTLLLSAQKSGTGVPQEFIEEKKKELEQKRKEALRIQQTMDQAYENSGSRKYNNHNNRERSRSPRRGDHVNYNHNYHAASSSTSAAVVPPPSTTVVYHHQVGAAPPTTTITTAPIIYTTTTTTSAGGYHQQVVHHPQQQVVHHPQQVVYHTTTFAAQPQHVVAPAAQVATSSSATGGASIVDTTGIEQYLNYVVDPNNYNSAASGAAPAAAATNTTTAAADQSNKQEPLPDWATAAWGGLTGYW